MTSLNQQTISIDGKLFSASKQNLHNYSFDHLGAGDYALNITLNIIAL